MTRASHDPSTGQHASISRPCGRACCWTTAVWLAVVSMMLLYRLSQTVVVGSWRIESSGQESFFQDAMIIAIASLLISYASLLPGLFGEPKREAVEGISSDPGVGRNPSSRESIRAESHRTGLLVAGVMIRMLGTVALFLTCRYQLAAQTETIAAMTIAWYVLLTFVDVLVLARELPRSAKLNSPRRPEYPADGQGLARD